MEPRFEPTVLERHPAYDFISESVRRRVRAQASWPDPDTLTAWAHEAGDITHLNDFRFVDWAEQALSAPRAYERCVDSGKIPTRPRNWHDFMNALVWMHFPRSKALLNRIQLDADLDKDRRNGRGRRQNAGAHFDECGAVVLCDAPHLLELVRALRWAELFQRRRAELHLHFKLLLVGHGLLDLLRAPHRGLVAKALLLPCDSAVLKLEAAQLRRHSDAALGRQLSSPTLSTASLSPMPVLGLPGWFPDQDAAFYADADYFRTERRVPLTPARQSPSSRSSQ
ncbi:MAG TPA: DUF3025 domain-containing protein [Polyangiaceae bacterium]|nr:DUF3025 domain-containing protein [Polyangiaceae bacterium]